MFYIVRTPVGLMTTLVKPDSSLPVVEKAVCVSLSLSATGLSQEDLEVLINLPESSLDWEKEFAKANSKRVLNKLSKNFLEWCEPLDEFRKWRFLDSLWEQSEIVVQKKAKEEEEARKRPYPSEADVVDATSLQDLFDEFDKDDVIAEIQSQLVRHAGPFLDPNYAKELEEYGFVFRKTKEEELDWFFSNAGYRMAVEQIIQKGVHDASLDEFDCGDNGNLSGYEPEEIIASWKRLGIIN